MIIYNITVSIDEGAHEDWVKWMKETHIPDVLKTELFYECRMSRILAEEEGGLAYSIQFTTKSMEDYEKYISDHAPRLRDDHERNFGGKFAAFRTLLNLVHQVNG